MVKNWRFVIAGRKPQHRRGITRPLRGRQVQLPADDGLGLAGHDEPDMHFNLHRVNPSNGKSLWHFYQNRAPRRVDFEGREIMLHFRGELMVLNYWSL